MKNITKRYQVRFICCAFILHLTILSIVGAQEIRTPNLKAVAPVIEPVQAIYSNSDGSTFVPKNGYPKFSWESTPVYYMFGDTKHLLTPEEVRFIAGKTGFLTIEKSHGLDELGAAELGTKHEAAAFKKVNPDIKVLFYFNSAWAWPFTSYNKNFTPEKINDYPELKSYLLVNPETGELNSRENYIRHTYSFDVLNPDFRKWWVETVARGVEESGCDGAFIDQMHGFYSLREDKKEEVHKAQGELISALKKKLGPDKIVLGNNTTDEIARYAYPAIDANMFEHYSSALLSKETLLKDWDDMLRLAKDGKMSIFRIGVGKGPFGASRSEAQLKIYYIRHAEVWPELREGPGMLTILSRDIPDLDIPILNLGDPIELPEEEKNFFVLRKDSPNDYKSYPGDADENLKVAYMKYVSLHAIDMIEKRFGGTDKSILLAGHNSSGVSLLKLLLKEEPKNKRGIISSGIWMVEQQKDGTYQLKIYNSEVLGE